MNFDPTLTPQAGTCVDYPEAQPDRLTVVMWEWCSEGFESFAQGMNVGVRSTKTPVLTWRLARATLLL